jgi:hypothetical protein
VKPVRAVQVAACARDRTFRLEGAVVDRRSSEGGLTLRRARTFTVLSLLCGSIAGVSTAASQSGLEILSKADAVQLFKMSKQQWQQNVATVVAAGLGTPSPDGTTLSVKTPTGYAITRPDYSRGNSRPAFVQVTIAYPPGGPLPAFTDTMAADLIAHTQQQMAPEFDVLGNTERLQGGLVFFFIISERPKGKQ